MLGALVFGGGYFAQGQPGVVETLPPQSAYVEVFFSATFDDLYLTAVSDPVFLRAL